MMFYNVPQRFCVYGIRFRANYIPLWYYLTPWHRLRFYTTYHCRLGSLAKVRLKPFDWFASDPQFLVESIEQGGVIQSVERSTHIISKGY